MGEGPRTRKELQEDRGRRMKQKEAANLESTLEACGISKFKCFYVSECVGFNVPVNK